MEARMKLKKYLARAAIVGALTFLPLGQRVEAQQQMCVDFEPPLVLGTQYGAPGPNPMGQVVFTSSQIPVAVDYFIWSNGGTTFNYAQIDPMASPIGSGQSIRTNNINLTFNFSQVGFLPVRVTFSYRDLGGNENLSVNGCPPFAGDLVNAPSAMCGANIAVSTSPMSGGVAGKVELQGLVFNMRVGGQEFWLDDVCVHEK
jgi:hypothetical protein